MATQNLNKFGEGPISAFLFGTYPDQSSGGVSDGQLYTPETQKAVQQKFDAIKKTPLATLNTWPTTKGMSNQYNSPNSFQAKIATASKVQSNKSVNTPINTTQVPAQTLGNQSTLGNPTQPTNEQLLNVIKRMGELSQAGATETKPTEPLFNQVVSNLANTKMRPELEQAYATAANLESGMSAGQNAIMNKPIPLEFQQGQAAALQRDYGTQLLSAQKILEKELAGQQLQQTGQIAAGSLAQPIQVAPGSTAYNPITGQQVAGGLGGYVDYSTAQQVLSGANAYKDAVNSNGQAFNYDQSKTPQENWSDFQQNYLPNSRTYQSGLVSSGLGSNIGKAGGGGNAIVESAINQANVQGYNQALKDYNDLNSSFQGAKELGTMLLTTLRDGGLNQADLTKVNETVNGIKGQISDPAFARFTSTLSNARSMYANILATGGGTIPTEATKAMDTIINPNAKINAIAAAIDQLNNEVQRSKIIPQAEKINQYLTKLQGTGGNSTSTTTGGSGGNFSDGQTSSDGSLVYKNGKWVKA